MKKTELSKEEKEFISESNHIEGEYTVNAFDDACDAWRWALKNKNKVIDLKYIKKIHKELAKRLNPQIAGKFRKIQVGVMTSKGFREGAPWFEVEERLKDLCTFSPRTADECIDWHVKFEHIHPFQDFNGRTGRILMNIQRIKNKIPILIIHTGLEQQTYYKLFGDKDI